MRREVSAFTSTDRFNLNGGSKSTVCGCGVSGIISGSRVLHGMVASIVGANWELCGEHRTVCSVPKDELTASGIKRTTLTIYRLLLQINSRITQRDIFNLV